MMFLMHLELCYFSIISTSAFPIWGRGSNHRWGGSYPLKRLRKCFEVTFISLLNISIPNLKQTCWVFLNISLEDLHGRGEGRSPVPLLLLPLPLDILVYSTAPNKGHLFPYQNFKKLKWTWTCTEKSVLSLESRLGV